MEVIELMQKQMERQEQRYEQQLEVQKQQLQQPEADQKALLEAILKAIGKPEPVVSTLQSATPSFMPSDFSSELWTNYWARFFTFGNIHAVSKERKAKIFLTNQSSTTCKLLSNLASQETPLKSISELTMTEIETYMIQSGLLCGNVLNIGATCSASPVRLFWNWPLVFDKLPLAAISLQLRIHWTKHCVVRTRFICSINTEAVLKALFKYQIPACEDCSLFINTEAVLKALSPPKIVGNL